MPLTIVLDISENRIRPGRRAVRSNALMRNCLHPPRCPRGGIACPKRRRTRRPQRTNRRHGRKERAHSEQRIPQSLHQHRRTEGVWRERRSTRTHCPSLSLRAKPLYIRSSAHQRAPRASPLSRSSRNALITAVSSPEWACPAGRVAHMTGGTQRRPADERLASTGGRAARGVRTAAQSTASTQVIR